jgi:hypothetical protein
MWLNAMLLVMAKDWDSTRNAQRDHYKEVANEGRIARGALGLTGFLGWAFGLAAREVLKTKPAKPWFFKTIGWLGIAAGAASTLGFFSAAKTIRQTKRKMEELSLDSPVSPVADGLSPGDEAEGRHVRDLYQSENRGRSRHFNR